MEEANVPHFPDSWTSLLASNAFPDHNIALGHSWGSTVPSSSQYAHLGDSIHSSAPPQPYRQNSTPYLPLVNPIPPSTSLNPSYILPSQHLQRGSSHLDLPNFPLPRPFFSDLPIPERQEGNRYTQFSSDFLGSPSQLVGFDALTSSALNPISRPVSRLSWDSERSAGNDFLPWPASQLQQGFIDLTADSSPPRMPVTTRKRSVPATRTLLRHSTTPSSSTKRRKTEASSTVQELKVEEADLRDIDEDCGLSRVLEQQRLMSIKAQQDLADKPINFSSLQCIICMESMTDISVTHCGEW